MKFFQADLSASPDFVLVGDGDLREDRAEWVQPLDRWTMINYGHSGIVTVNVHSVSYQSGTVVVFPPGSRGSHNRVGGDRYYRFLTFTLPGSKGEMMAVPFSFTVTTETAADWQRASESIGRSHTPAKSFAWSLLWKVARPVSQLRENSLLYLAEDWIRHNLSRPFTVSELATSIDVSQSTLLRAFLQEHGLSPKQFVLDRRVREAARLLSTTSLPIKQIAAKVGVPDLQQFNRLVRFRTGMSPRQYRQSLE